MGKNKDRLNQKSIPWADSILEQVINLPAAGGEDLQSTAEVQTTAVEALMKMVSRKIAMNNGEGQYVWKKLTAEGGDFVDFVVSADTEAYPDGGTQDGYWYELVEEGVSGIDYGEVTVSETKTTLTFNHNLKKTPRCAVLLPIYTPSTLNASKRIGYFGDLSRWLVLTTKSGGTIGISTLTTQDNGYYLDFDENTVSFVGGNLSFQTSINYVWFVLA